MGKEIGWLSFHIFIWDFDLFDEYLMYVSKKFKDNSINDVFYIRYWEGSPHLRIRIKNCYNNYLVKKILSDSLTELILNNPKVSLVKLNKEVFYKNNFNDGKNINISELPWYDNLSIVSIPYVREIDRYGGSNLMPLSELAFVKSSDVAILLIKQKLTRIKKIIIFFRFVGIFLHSIIENEKDRKKIVSLGSKFWSSLGIKDHMKDNQKYELAGISNKINIDGILTPFMKSIKKITLKKGNIYDDYLLSILFSHIHMFANRLGVSIDIELSCYNYFKEQF